MAWNDYAELINILNEQVENHKLISIEHFEAVNEMLQDEEVRERLGFDLYQDATVLEDFSQFEKLHPILRNYAAAQYMWGMPSWLKNMMQGRQEETYEELRDALTGDPNQRRRFEDEIAERAMDPRFRLGCSLMSRDDWHYTFYDDMAVDHLMRETLRPMNSEQIARVRTMAGGDQEKANEMIAQNIEKQVQLARTLLMAHIGNTYVYVDHEVNENPMNRYEEGYNELKTRSAASMLSHCSRTAFVLPAGENVSHMVDSAVGLNMGAASGNHRRSAATHTTRNGSEFTDFEEIKRISLINQRGMNIAIGGLGNIGIPGVAGQDRTLKNDGSCGHMYMRVDKGGKSKTTSLLIGFESDAPQTTNQQGHTHNSSAAPEYMSSFLAQRADEFGDKYGGRRVDLTGYTPDQLSNILDTFSSHYRALLTKGISDPQMAGRAMLVNRLLAGEPIGVDSRKLSMLFNQAGIDREQTRDLATDCLNAKLRAQSKMKDMDLGSATAGYLPPDEAADAIEPLQELKKPSLWVRFKAKLGITSAKEQVRAYHVCCDAVAEPTTDPMTEAPMPRDRARESNEAIQRMMQVRERQRQHQRQEVTIDALAGHDRQPVDLQRPSAQRTRENQMGGMENQ